MPETLNYDQAAAVIMDNVFAPTFFQKLAEYGVAPADQQEAIRLIELADKLRYEDEVGHAKTAAEKRSLVELAHQDLDTKLGLARVPTFNPAVKQAAVSLATNQAIRDAALLYQDAVTRNLPNA